MPDLAAVRAKLTEIRGVRRITDREVVIQRRVMLTITTVPLAGLLFAIVQMWGWGISGVDLGLLIGFYVFTGLGITVGYHRLFTHRSFEAVAPVRWIYAIAGSMAIQGAVIDWVATHRRHHAYSDDVGDPHSPHLDSATGVRGILRGLFHAHMGWLFEPAGTENDVWAPDLMEDRAIHRIHRAFPWLVLASFVLPGILGGLVTWSIGGLVSGFVWGGLIRIFLLHHVTWSINSICHFYGTRPFDSRDEARNNFVMALLAFGEGWHNAHHAFPASARHGLRWWEVDFSWITIRLMKLVGLVKSVKLPSSNQLARKMRPRTPAIDQA
ncbi:MAG: acyl-CoA desaturase [Nitriliruptorales bacterium]|nr:acyl-CoA desaturase [Nitriliruptorales bacterium]